MHRDDDPSNCAAGNLYWARISARGNPKRILSAEQEAEVIALRGVMSSGEIARKFGVSSYTIRLTWRLGERSNPGSQLLSRITEADELPPDA